MTIFSLTQKTILITGGGTGIGLGIAQAMVEAGGRVVLVGRRESILQEACATLGEMASYRVKDIARTSDLPAFIDELEHEVAPVDVLVNNAGLHLKRESMDTSDEAFEQVIQINLNGVFALSRVLGKRMISRGKGSIIMLSSMTAIYGMPKVAAYAASKGAIRSLTMSLANDFADSGVRVNAIAPGYIETAMFHQATKTDPARKQKILNRIPMNRLGRPIDVGHTAVFLASDASAYVTGTHIPIDGGASIGF
ncbi:MAG: SDR family oxidoreductase [Bacteroidota bacterium]